MAQPVVGDGSIELARGRRAPYTQVGDWVALAAISRAAKALYWLLAAHVNPQRDDGWVWPSRRALAEALGYAKVESVDPLVKELTKLGAVEVERRQHANGAPAPNRYVVHETPPAGYTGPTSLADFYDRRRRRGVAPSTGVPPSAGVRVPRSTGGGVPPYTGHELDQGELDQEELPPPSTPRAEPAAAEVDSGGEGGGNGPADPEQVAADLVAGAPWPGRPPSPTARARLIRRVVTCLDRGHSAEAVQATLAEPLSGAGDPVAVEVARLRDLAATDPEYPPPAAAPVVAQVEPHPYAEGADPARCGECGRVDGATVGGRPVHPRPESATECDHGRHPVGCPQCRSRTAQPPAHPLGGGARRAAGTRQRRDGIAALDAALAEIAGCLPGETLPGQVGIAGTEASPQARRDGSAVLSGAGRWP